MKSLLLTIVLALASISMYAQGTATVNQFGTTNNVALDQVGTNNATINQGAAGAVVTGNQVIGATGTLFGDYNFDLNSSALQTSSGAFNDVQIDQLANNAIVGLSQTGPGNDADVLQSANGVFANIRQFGASGTFDLTQSAENSRAALLQEGGNGREFNSGTVVQSAFSRMFATQGGDNNTFILKQTGGYNNVADIFQRGSTSSATIDQIGAAQERNELDIDQLFGGNLATISQANGSFAETRQGTFAVGAGSGDNALTLTQDGLGNRVLLTQASSSIAIVEQTGVGNLLVGTLGNQNSTALSYGGSELTLTQTGDDNQVALSQDGASIGTITQGGGNLNTVVLQQTLGATATITQTGGTNSAVVTQN